MTSEEKLGKDNDRKYRGEKETRGSMGKYKMTSHRGRRDVEKFPEWKLVSLAQSDTDLARVEYEASENAPTPDVSTLTLAR